MKLPLLRALGAAALLTAVLPLVNASSSFASSDSVAVVGYSVLSPAMSALEAAFERTSAGRGVTFTNSFGASTTQAEDVVAGQPADVTIFSQQPDLNLLVKAGLVSSSWASYGPGKAEHNIVADSVVAIVVRKGNPLDVTGWNSLTKPGVQIVTPDPISSGSARWNLLAAYESQILQGKKVSQATAFLNKLIGNVVAEPPSGSKSLSTFTSGAGNVLLAYEADANFALKSGQPISIVEPAQNILIENPAALTTTGLANAGATAFYKFLFSPAGQSIFIAEHFRSPLAQFQQSEKGAFYTPPKLTTPEKLGGWTKITNTFFSSNGLVTKIEAAHGFTS